MVDLKSGGTEQASTDQQILYSWREVLREYKGRTGHDLEHNVTSKNGDVEAIDKSLTDLAAKKHSFKSYRTRHEKTRGYLKLCIRPLQSMSALASTAVSLTPFAPAATVFGAGMYLISKLLTPFQPDSKRAGYSKMP